MKKKAKIINLVTEADKRYNKSAHAAHIVRDNQEPTVMAVQRVIDNLIATYGMDALNMIDDVMDIKRSRKVG